MTHYGAISGSSKTRQLGALQVSDAALGALAAGCRVLHTLSIAYCTEVSDAGADIVPRRQMLHEAIT